MKETSKARPRRQAEWAFVHRYFVGTGLDVGSGDDPLRASDYPNVVRVEILDRPDRSNIRLPFEDATFDFVHASNVLEHIATPAAAIAEWLRVLRPGGHLILTVPDFERYEQCVWPSRWNKGHRQRFNIDTVIDLLRRSGAALRKIQLVDTRYDYSLAGVDQTFPIDGAEAFIEAVVQK